jgi:hypothetical protein
MHVKISSLSPLFPGYYAHGKASKKVPRAVCVSIRSRIVTPSPQALIDGFTCIH